MTTQKVDITNSLLLKMEKASSFNGTFLDGEMVETESENEDKFFENKRQNKSTINEHPF